MKDIVRIWGFYTEGRRLAFVGYIDRAAVRHGMAEDEVRDWIADGGSHFTTFRERDKNPHLRAGYYKAEYA